MKQKKKCVFLSMLLGTLGASLLENLLKGKGIMRAGEGTIRVGKNLLMEPHSLNNFELQKYYQNKTNFNSAHSRNNLPKTNDGVCVIKRDEYKSIETH